MYQTMANNTSTANQTTGATFINEGMREILGETAWPFLEASATTSTVASQQFYNLPFDYSQLIDCTVTLGTVVYKPIEVTSRKDWDFINNTTSVTSNIPQFFFIFGQTLGLWPIPSTAISNGITFNYKKIVRDISLADYTTGTITTATNAGYTVVGSGTAWTSQMVGSYIRITRSNIANTGDGFYYQIGSVESTTSLTLSRPYNGTSIAVGTAAYTIGDCMVVPEKYQRGPVYYALANYWMKEEDDNGRSAKFMEMFTNTKTQMLTEYGNKTTDPTVDDGSSYPIPNPNLFIWGT